MLTSIQEITNFTAKLRNLADNLESAQDAQSLLAKMLPFDFAYTEARKQLASLVERGTAEVCVAALKTSGRLKIL